MLNCAYQYSLLRNYRCSLPSTPVHTHALVHRESKREVYGACTYHTPHQRERTQGHQRHTTHTHARACTIPINNVAISPRLKTCTSGEHAWRMRGLRAPQPTLTGVRVCAAVCTLTHTHVIGYTRARDTHIHTREVISIRGADTA